MYKVLTQKLWQPPRAIGKLLLIMKLTTLLLITAILQVSASGYAQKITLSEKNTALVKVFDKISTQSGYDFLVSSEMLKNAKPVSIQVKDLELKDVLKKIFENQPLQYEVQEKMVVVSRKEQGVVENLIARFQTTNVRGRVVDENGRPLPGAVVRVKGGKGSTLTNTNGEFLLSNIQEDAILVVSYLGYLTKDVSVKNAGTIRLEQSTSKLDEIQIIAYGQVEKKYSTSNIGNISGESISRQPVTNLLLALQGQVPGLSIQQTSGNTLGNVNISIQGRNSIGNGNEPFYVIDGVPYAPGISASLVGGALPIGSNGALGSTFNFINPADIESVQILKDADATAIYGSRAANGAILITTKKGKPGQSRVSVDMQSGWGKITRKLDLLNTSQYLEMRKEAYKNDGLTVPISTTTPTSSNYDLTIWDQNKQTDWQDVLVGGTAQYTNIQSSISGGNLNTQFFAGGGYNKQTTVYPVDLADVKGNVHFNLNHNSENNKLKFSLSSTYVQDKNELNGGGDLMGFAVKMAPNSPELYANGGLNWEPNPKNPEVSTFDNPMKYSTRKFTGNTNNLISSSLISYEPFSRFVIKASAGYNRLDGGEINTFPTTYFKPEIAKFNTPGSSFLNRSSTSYILEPQITYSHVNDLGVFDFLIGTSFQQTKSNIIGVNASGFTNNEQLTNLSGATTLRPGTNSESLYKYNALFTRLNFRVANKYIINVTARRDGSSRFGDENKLHNFYSVGGAWLFGSEKFVQSILPFLSTGKLRANYGTTGNDQIGDYSYLATLSTYNVDVPYQGGIGLISNGHANPSLQWEETRKLNIGLDLGFFQNRISFSGNYFNNRSSNQLIGYPLSVITGFSSVVKNLAATVQNTGIELQLDAVTISSKNFNWRTSLNATIPRNKLIAFPDLANSGYASDYIIGQPLTIRRLFPYAGVNVATGLYEYYDAKGVKTSSPDYDIDRTNLVNVERKWYGGLTNSFIYKNLQLDFLVQYVNQIGQNAKFIGASAGFFNNNQLTNVLDRWQTANTMVDVEKFTTRSSTSYSNGRYSDAQYSNASFLRLKNASIAYSFSPLKLRYIGVTNLRVYIQSQNLLTFTNYEGTDPESQYLEKLPPLRMYTVGLQITL